MAHTKKTNLGIGRGMVRSHVATQDNANQHRNIKQDNGIVTSANGSLQNSTTISKGDDSTFNPDAGGSTSKHSLLSAEANEFYPRNYIADLSKVSESVPPDEERIELESVTAWLSDIVNDITLEPGTYESAVRPFIESVCPILRDSSTLNTVLNIIIAQSIVQPNFRYNGARLCNELGEFLSDSKLQFRTILLQRCQEEMNVGLKYFDNDPVHIQGLVCFLAELYIQLELKPATGLRINILRDALYELLEQLVLSCVPNNIKCVCKTLKLAGYALDQDNSLAMDALLQSLHSIALSETTENMDVVKMIGNVEQLRLASWGTNNVVERDRNVTNVIHHAVVEETQPVFYGPDGIVLTHEESAFLQENFAPEVEYYEESWTNRDQCDRDGEMNEEEEAAYEEFLKMIDTNKNN